MLSPAVVAPAADAVGQFFAARRMSSTSEPAMPSPPPAAVAPAADGVGQFFAARRMSSTSELRHGPILHRYQLTWKP